MDMIKNISNFFFAISEMQKVFLVLQAYNFFYILQHGIKFSQLLNLHSCCRIRATKCVQRTIALYQYKLFNLFPFSVIEFFKVVMFKPWTQCVIEIRESFFCLRRA